MTFVNISYAKGAALNIFASYATRGLNQPSDKTPKYITRKEVTNYLKQLLGRKFSLKSIAQITEKAEEITTKIFTNLKLEHHQQVNVTVFKRAVFSKWAAEDWSGDKTPASRLLHNIALIAEEKISFPLIDDSLIYQQGFFPKELTQKWPKEKATGVDKDIFLISPPPFRPNYKPER